MVLACLAMVTVALMLMLSFNVTNAIHEKVRIQATADSQALSVATLEARAFNTMAFMNRSIAGAMVAEMAIHAWWAIAESEVSMLGGGAEAFAKIVQKEAKQCNHTNPHCAHLTQATRIKGQFESAVGEYQGKLGSLEGKFKEAVEGLQNMMKDLHVDQKRALDNTRREIASTSTTLRELKSISAPHAYYETAIDDLNVSEFACALEGSNFDDACNAPSWKPAGRVRSASERGAIMESAAMAARPRFAVGNGYWRQLANDAFNGGGVGSAGASDESSPRDVSNPDKPTSFQRPGELKVERAAQPKTWVRNNQVGAQIGTATVSVKWLHNSESGSTASRKVSGSPYVGLPCSGDNCFVNFRASSDPQADYGQPTTYGALSQDLRLQLNGQPGPWEINNRGTVRIELTPGEEARLVLVPRGWAFAVSKGKTYFHQLGVNGWQVPPNLFDPFWRAKLQSFSRQELSSVLHEAGDRPGAEIIQGGGAVEGKYE